MPEALQAASVGPVDVAVLSFEGNEFNGEIAPALTDLQEKGIVRLIDLAFVRKDEQGTVTVIQIADQDVVDAYSQIADPRFDLLNEADLRQLTSSVRPGSSAMVVVWENTWAARFASAVRDSHGRVTAYERIPFDVVQRALAAVEYDSAQEQAVREEAG